jgi:hypothetical protein
MANITGNNLKGKELLWVNWHKLNTDNADALKNPLKSAGILLFFVPLFGSGVSNDSGMDPDIFTYGRSAQNPL